MRVTWCEGTRLAFLLIAGLMAAPAEAQRGEPRSLDDVAVNSGPGVATVLITTAGAPPDQQRADGLAGILRTPGNVAARAMDPGGTPPAPAVTEAAPARVPAISLLYGVIYGAGGWVAYIEDPTTRAIAPYRVGDSIGGQTIEKIEDERVVLKGPEGPVEIKLSDEKPGGRKRPAEKAPSGGR
jgi:hypothetical protein